MPDNQDRIRELQILAQRIEEAFDAGANSQGRTLLEDALERSRDVPAYREYFRGGAARYLAGDRDDQTRRIELALELSPDDPFLMRSLGISLSLGGNDEEALAWFDKALERNPADYLAMRRKGVSLSRLGRYDEALMWFDNALEANPRDGASMRNLGVCLSKRGRNEEALGWFDKALAENPRDYAALRQKGVSYSMLGKLDKAVECYDRALEINPSNAAALTNKARTLIELRDYAGAIAVYETLIASDPNNPYHYLEKAIALGKLGRAADASDAVNRAYGLANPTETLRRGKTYWLKRLGLDSGKRPGAKTPDRPRSDAGGDYGDIARVMEKTWEIFREDIRTFRKKIEEAKNNFNVFINSPGMFARDRVFLLGARKWNSFTPTLPLGEEEETSVGGGYFLYANGVGTVIDPGFDFLENFSAMGGRLADINNIVVTHAHNDHTNDLESILTLFYQRVKNAGKTVSARLGRARPRPAVNLYMNLGAFQKFSPMINLRASEHIGQVTIITPGGTYDLEGSGIRMRALPAHHDEIFSKTYAVGLHFTLPTRPAKTVVFTGDTGLFPSGADIRADNVADLEIGARYGIEPGTVDYFIPHLGSIGDNELHSPDRQDKLGESFYPNHLGVQGLIRLITMLRPKYVFVSEFGEELKGFIVLLMELINRCVREIDELNSIPPGGMPTILPMDLYFFCDLAREEIYCARSESFEPLAEATYRHLDKNNASQFYYERKGFDGAGCDEYFALKKLEYACRINSGPFSDKSNRTHRFVAEIQ
ncbi:MAG: tetratricopeptide repeat protein [Planctomycetota bacterium]|jgi:tetratricopeptide (TPR) repeat protein/glyoxylase-like metal-dependent hydrolase (beta-lactamase superfamily II)|nr:tetratricopeptide repeat protein [Planctomycetota bacterium]